MQIETPYGEVTLHFFRNNHVRVAVDPLKPITVNGVKLRFDRELAIIDGRWEMAQSGNKEGTFTKHSYLNVRYDDWQRGGAPSHSAYIKIRQWIEAFLIPDLNRGVYSLQLKQAERQHFTREIVNRMNEINEANQKIIRLKEEIEKLDVILENLPV